jgi:hypothetical protein
MKRKIDRELRTSARLAARVIAPMRELVYNDPFYRLMRALDSASKADGLDTSTQAYLLTIRAELRASRDTMGAGFSGYRNKLESLATILGVK